MQDGGLGAVGHELYNGVKVWLIKHPTCTSRATAVGLRHVVTTIMTCTARSSSVVMERPPVSEVWWGYRE